LRSSVTDLSSDLRQPGWTRARAWNVVKHRGVSVSSTSGGGFREELVALELRSRPLQPEGVGRDRYNLDWAVCVAARMPVVLGFRSGSVSVVSNWSTGLSAAAASFAIDLGYAKLANGWR
jgi:hypothetical protein